MVAPLVPASNWVNESPRANVLSGYPLGRFPPLSELSVSHATTPGKGTHPIAIQFAPASVQVHPEMPEHADWVLAVPHVDEQPPVQVQPVAVHVDCVVPVQLELHEPVHWHCASADVHDVCVTVLPVGHAVVCPHDADHEHCGLAPVHVDCVVLLDVGHDVVCAHAPVQPQLSPAPVHVDDVSFVGHVVVAVLETSHPPFQVQPLAALVVMQAVWLVCAGQVVVAVLETAQAPFHVHP